MNRRTLLRGAGASLAAFAGCLGGIGGSGDGDDGAATTGGRGETKTETGAGTTGEPTTRTTGESTTETATRTTTGTSTPTDRSIRVVRSVGPGGFDRPWTMVVDDDGRIRLTVDCDEGERTATDRLSESERDALGEMVLAVDRDSLETRYTATVDDAPEETLTLSVDGRETEVTYNSTRVLPDALSRLVTRLDRYAGRFDRPICGSDPSIRVSMTVSGGLTPTPWRHTVTVADDGTLEFVHVCKTSDHRETGRQRLSESEHARVERLVRQLDVASLADQYTCGETCPTDLPGTTLTIHVGDRKKEIYFYQPDREDVPERLRTLLGLLSSYGERFEYDCPEQTGTPSGDGAGG